MKMKKMKNPAYLTAVNSPRNSTGVEGRVDSLVVVVVVVVVVIG